MLPMYILVWCTALWTLPCHDTFLVQVSESDRTSSCYCPSCRPGKCPHHLSIDHPGLRIGFKAKDRHSLQHPAVWSIASSVWGLGLCALWLLRACQLGVLHAGRGMWDGEGAGGMEIIKGLVLLQRGTGMWLKHHLGAGNCSRSQYWSDHQSVFSVVYFISFQKISKLLILSWIGMYEKQLFGIAASKCKIFLVIPVSWYLSHDLDIEMVYYYY